MHPETCTPPPVTVDPVIVTTQSQLQRLVEDAVAAGVSRALAQAGAGSDAESGWVRNDELVALTGLSKSTLQRLRSSGELPYSKVGQRVLYRKADVEALLASGAASRASA